MHIGDRFGYPKRKKVVGQQDKKRPPQDDGNRHRQNIYKREPEEIEMNESGIDNSRK